MKIYIAGKIAGGRRYRAKFREAAKALEAAGHVVLNPATLPDGLTDADYMRICMAMVDAADLAVFWHTGNEPATLTACVFGVCGFENGVMGWIKTTKEKQAAARTSGSGQKAAPVEPPTEREEPPDAGIK